MNLTEDVTIAAIFTVLGAISAKFFDYLKTRAHDIQESESHTHDQIVAGYALTISKLDSRITTLEAELERTRKQHQQELKEVREEHHDCLKIQGELRAEIAVLRERINIYSGETPDAK